ncbi:leucine-rich repeat protein [Alistipes ihumii]|uniref:leucine-rich repeat protein n=1 Tax=Alistipes ihumii TaxID=1470347 RepID=UPI003AB1658C
MIKPIKIVAMKRLFALFAATSLLFVSGCSKYDDSALTGRVDDLENRVDQLEQLCKQMNTNISSLRTLVEAVQQNDYVTSVTPVSEDGKTIGYTITFGKSNPITIYHGKDGEKGDAGATGNDGHAPVIGVKQDTDGIYYWTLDGEWFTDDSGRKIKAEGTDGKDGNNGQDGKPGEDGRPGGNGITPLLKIENDRWLLSMDEGKTWDDIGPATGEDGDSMFESVTEDNENAYFKLTDGSTITIPKKQGARFSIQFDKTEIAALQAGDIITVKYTITGATEQTIVRAFAQNGWKASVLPASISAGSIKITAPDPLVKSEILVFVSNETDQTVMAVIDCAQGTITVADNSFDIAAEGATAQIVLQTNIDYVVDIPNEAQTWLSVAETRAAMREETLTFIIAPNDGITERFTSVSFNNKEGKTMQTIVFRQAGSKIAGQLEIHVETIGTLKDVLSGYDYASLESLKINGVLNDEDFLVIYHDMPALRELDLSEVNISKLPARAFYRSSNVERVVLPKSLTEIGEYVFAESQLKEIHLYDNLTTIGESAFAGCIRLANITIPANVITIGASAFANCEALFSVVFEPNCTLTAIGNSAFKNTSIQAIAIPAQVAQIGASAFADCEALSSVVFEPNCALTAIASNTFANTPIQTITIPAQVAEIDEAAFSKCNALHTVRFESNNKLTTINTAFKGLPSLTTITIPANVRSIEPNAFADCTQLSNVFFEENAQLTRIGGGFSGSSAYGAFQNCKNLKEIQIPASVEIIEAAAFKNCTSLSRITFERGSHLKTIGGGGFYTSGTLLSISYHGAFSQCTALTTIEIPASVEVIEPAVFNECTSLVSVVFEKGSRLSKIGGGFITDSYGIQCNAASGAFRNCTALTGIEIPAEVRTIEAGAFKGCVALKSVTFKSDSRLETIEGGAYYEQDYYGAFSDCISLEIITISASVKSIGHSAFRGCISLSNISFAENSVLTTIGDYAFYQCPILHTMDAANCRLIASIGEEAFSSSNEMRLFKIGTMTPPECGSNPFGQVGTYSVLKVPSGATNVYKSASYWRAFASITALDE